MNPLTPNPTKTLTLPPTSSTSTSVSTSTPTSVPTTAPTSTTTSASTSKPTSTPTLVPTSALTSVPTTAPTMPTTTPSSITTSTRTLAPTSALTSGPTSAPTSIPTSIPTLAPTSALTSAPTKESSDNCRDDPEFRFRFRKKDLPCEKIHSRLCNKWDRITKKLVKARCPVQCGYCNEPERYINPTELIPVKVGHRREQVKVSCDIIPMVPLVECTDVINRKNISDFCPGSCNLCNQW